MCGYAGCGREFLVLQLKPGSIWAADLQHNTAVPEGPALGSDEVGR